MVPRLLPAAPLAVRNRYLTVVPRSMPVVHEVLDRGAQAVASGGTRCASQVLDLGAQALHVALLVERLWYLIVVPRLSATAPLVVCRR